MEHLFSDFGLFVHFPHCNFHKHASIAANFLSGNNDYNNIFHFVNTVPKQFFYKIQQKNLIHYSYVSTFEILSNGAPNVKIVFLHPMSSSTTTTKFSANNHKIVNSAQYTVIVKIELID